MQAIYTNSKPWLCKLTTMPMDIIYEPTSTAHVAAARSSLALVPELLWKTTPTNQSKTRKREIAVVSSAQQEKMAKMTTCWRTAAKIPASTRRISLCIFCISGSTPDRDASVRAIQAFQRVRSTKPTHSTYTNPKHTNRDTQTDRETCREHLIDVFQSAWLVHGLQLSSSSLRLSCRSEKQFKERDLRIWIVRMLCQFELPFRFNNGAGNGSISDRLRLCEPGFRINDSDPMFWSGPKLRGFASNLWAGPLLYRPTKL